MVLCGTKKWLFYGIAVKNLLKNLYGVGLILTSCLIVKVNISVITVELKQMSCSKFLAALEHIVQCSRYQRGKKYKDVTLEWNPKRSAFSHVLHS